MEFSDSSYGEIPKSYPAIERVLGQMRSRLQISPRQNSELKLAFKFEEHECHLR
jgi:hypothetical protein